MDTRTKHPSVRRLLKLAYHRGRNPKRPLPGPFHDLVVVTLFVIFGVGYLFS
jgi:hypothetical protein